jgi:hypothetical protein
VGVEEVGVAPEEVYVVSEFAEDEESHWSLNPRKTDVVGIMVDVEQQQQQQQQQQPVLIWLH